MLGQGELRGGPGAIGSRLDRIGTGLAEFVAEPERPQTEMADRVPTERAASQRGKEKDQ
jgi:hypothetical protein